MKTAIVDLESDGLLLDMTTIHCAVIYDYEEKEYYEYRPSDIDAFVTKLMDFDKIVGHNICGFDLFAIKKLYPNFNWKDKIIYDTMVASKLCYYYMDKSFSHSLKSWGERLGNYKAHHEDWSVFSEEMLSYCKQDVAVTVDLYNDLDEFEWLDQQILDFEQEVQYCITQQYINGWTFDVKGAQKLHVELLQEYETALAELHKVFKPMFLPKGNIKTYKKVPHTAAVLVPAIDGSIKQKIDYYENQPIDLTEFNPSSSKHIVWWVNYLYGTQDWTITAKGNAKTDADTLNEMFSDKEWAKPLLHFFDVSKLLGMVVDGDNAWLKLERDGKIHHSVDILGTNTGRATHSSPNLAQVPSVRAYRGKEVRSLFTHTKGMVNVGCDLSGVELRCLAHYMNDPEYTKTLLEGDIHTVNQLAAGLPTRDNAKTFVYGFLYGAGDAKIGEIVGKGAREGKRLKEQFLEGLPTLDKLIRKVKLACKKGYLIGITGRRLHIRSEHSALNVLLQSLGAYISKEWMLVTTNMLQEANICYNQLGWIHDEIQLECYPEDADRVSEIIMRAATIAGENLQLRCRIDAEAKTGNSWYEVH